MTSAVILAGGQGTRLRSEVPDLPKPMAPINGRPFLEHQLSYWIGQGIDHFILSVGFRHEVIVRHFGKSFQGARIEYVVENSPLGTGGGMLLAAERIGTREHFLLLNGDTYFAVELRKLIEFSLMHSTDWCFSLFRTQEDGRYMGLDLAPDGRILSLSSGVSKIGGLANGGAYWVNCGTLDREKWQQNTKCSVEDDILPFAATSRQCLFGLECSGVFIDIGIPSDFRRAQHLSAFSNEAPH